MSAAYLMDYYISGRICGRVTLVAFVHITAVYCTREYIPVLNFWREGGGCRA